MDVYEKQIRCITEFASPVWTSGLTVDESNQLERIQKCCLRIILGDSYIDYSAALEMTGLVTLY